ncbi:hypothetical protein [Streptomyces iconiensis]|uniref:DUF732 domain-containing protein n=1 Tax=Streptomyces iconiensis TaxID=1384038 RepID=A0ABT6ZWP6_9ACTN|nr:hypothetical protein [Streptomyces iconiensis]MDJ1133490.1 hypothetical protein [Streptomyces iconiensis]
MNARKAGTTVAAVVLTAVTALTAGCGGGGCGAGDNRTSRPEPREQSQERRQEQRRDKEAGVSTPAPKGGGDQKSRAKPKVPEARLTPATGSFTKKQRRYLVGRVPEGLEPAAVLEAGEAACARIRSTADASEKDAISALGAGEIDNAVPAVRHLCPTYAPLLKKAGKGE